MAYFREYFSFLQIRGYLNSIVVAETQTGDVTACGFQNLHRIVSHKNVVNPKLLFPDLLANVDGHVYRVVMYEQKPIVWFDKGTIVSLWMYFLLAVSEKQNARISLIKVKDRKVVAGFYGRRQMDLTINTAVRIDDNNPKLMTYEETGICALVPRSNSVSFQFLLVKPFDSMIYVAFFMSLAAAGLVWRVYKNHGETESTWRFVFGALAYFLGQSLSVRSNRAILVVLMQVFIFMYFILGSLYQGELTANMIEPDQEGKLSTFNELYDSDLKLYVSENFENLLKHSGDYERVKSKLLVSGRDVFSVNFGTQSNATEALILPCYIAELLKNKVRESFYILDQKILTHYDRLEASYINPFLERMQKYMDMCFEGGLHHAWKVFSAENITNVAHEGEREILELGDFKQVFLILLFGLLASCLVFLVEIFYHRRIMSRQNRVVPFEYEQTIY